ncbi:MAG: elongation factor G [Candidatus Latescibacterota bacterium]|nr:MAG: elongation factor G [Candidatus Latescibacterota bacterium]
MKEYAPDKIRNIALVGHQDTGKTMVSEAILFTTGATSRIGRVEDGNTIMDTTPEEIERQISIQASLAYCEFKNHKINLIDTPGYEDFVGEVLGGLDVVEGAVVVIRAEGGVEVGTEKVWEYVRERGLPAVFCVNKMDKEHAAFDKCLEQLHEHFGRTVLAMQIPIGEGESFKGVIDLVDGKGYEYTAGGKGKSKEIPIPDDLKDKTEKLRRELFETAAENVEALMEKYLESETLTPEEVYQGLSVGVAAGDIFPVFCMSAESNIGTSHFLEGLIGLVPPPTLRPQKLVDSEDTLQADMSKSPAAKIFKNVSESHVGDMLYLRAYQGTLAGGNDIFNSTRNASERLGQLFFLQGKNRTETEKIGAGDIGAAVKLKSARIGDTLCDRSKPVTIPPTDYPLPSIYSAIAGAAKGDEDKIGAGLNRLKEEDPTFDVKVDNEIRQTLISGQGELHLEILVGRLKSRYGVEVVMSKPRIPYKETIAKTAQAQGKYKKQTGGRGQYGDVWLKVEPLPRGGDFEFVNAIVGGVVPGKFIPAVEKGVVAAMSEGVLAGYPVVDLKVTLYDGGYHTVDSSEQAFKVAGSMSFKKAATDAKLVLLEPIMNVEVKVPEEFMGDVMGDLSGRRGKIQGMEPQGRFNVVRCQVPLAELYRYSTHLRSITQGRGTHKREFSHYEEVPHDSAQKIIEEAKKEKEKE